MMLKTIHYNFRMGTSLDAAKSYSIFYLSRHISL
jgi:hypothetical protein